MYTIRVTVATLGAIQVWHYHPAGEGTAALGNGAVGRGYIGVACVQRPERAGVPGDPVRDSMGCGGVRPMVG